LGIAPIGLTQHELSRKVDEPVTGSFSKSTRTSIRFRTFEKISAPSYIDAWISDPIGEAPILPCKQLGYAGVP
jgi:hypothetical protein